jgi:hypothetical protein
LIVVPNDSILKQWVETIFETIPNAKVNVLGNLGKIMISQNLIIRTEKLPLLPMKALIILVFENITQELASKFSYISESELKSVNPSAKGIFRRIRERKRGGRKMKRGKIYDWEDFGFDHLTYDEVHNANHIVGKVRVEDRRFASDFRSQNQQTSNWESIHGWLRNTFRIKMMVEMLRCFLQPLLPINPGILFNFIPYC